MIQTLKKDFSRFEEIRLLRTVDSEEKKQAPDLKILNQKIKKSERKKRKLDMIERMYEDNRKRRQQYIQEENFEPIEIDFGYEDAIAFDSDKGTVCFQMTPYRWIFEKKLWKNFEKMVGDTPFSIIQIKKGCSPTP